MNMSTPVFPLQFRFWNKIARRYQPPGMYAVTGDGELLGWDTENGVTGAWGDPTPLDKTCVEVEPFIGFRAKDGTPVYLNDIVRFTYTVGDMAWEHMDEQETKWQEQMCGKSFVGIVRWSLGRFDVDCELGGSEHSPHMTFSVMYAGGSKVLGNAHEHPDWRAKWRPDYSWIPAIGDKGARKT